MKQSSNCDNRINQNRLKKLSFVSVAGSGGELIFLKEGSVYPRGNCKGSVLGN